MALLLSGNISLNPAPIKHPCKVCQGPIAKNHKAILCDICGMWSHAKCEGIHARKYKEIEEIDSFEWLCRSCIVDQQPFANAELDEMLDFIGKDQHQDENWPRHNLNANIITVCASRKKKKGLIMGHMNVNGLTRKLDYIKLLAKQSNMYVCMYSICKVNNRIKLKLVYNLVH